jgi:hypothetical protein
MATKTVVCPECDSPLAPGRFSCSACGALVAAVASSSRSLRVSDPARPPEPEPDDPDASITAQDDRTLEPDPQAEPVATPSPPVGWFATALEATPPGQPSWPDHPTWPLPIAEAGVAPVNPQEDVEPIDEEPHVPAGTYLPPSAVLPPAEALPLPGAAAPVREGHSRTRTWPKVGNPLGPLTVPPDVGTRIIAVGAAMAAFGFLLPWADIVIGSGRLGGSLLDKWGLAGPAAPTAFLLTLGLFALAVIRPNLPSWVGLSTASIGIASLLLGLAWPYVFGAFGATFGIYVVVIGALVLAAGGIVDRFASRHVESPAAV